MFLWHTLEPGDWVRTTQVVNTTLTDSLAGTGLPTGSRGVVIARTGGHVTVDLATSYGTVSTTVPSAYLKLIKRSGGIRSFHDNVSFLTVIRLALAGFLLWPCVQYTIDYLVTYHSFDGFIESLPMAVLDALGQMIFTVINQPVKTIIYLAFLTILGWIAFPHSAPWNRPRRRKK